jgi:hypothetical protein
VDDGICLRRGHEEQYNRILGGGLVACCMRVIAMLLWSIQYNVLPLLVGCLTNVYVDTSANDDTNSNNSRNKYNDDDCHILW